MPSAIFFAPLVVPANAGTQTISGFGGMENMPMMVVKADAQVLDALRGAGTSSGPSSTKPTRATRTSTGERSRP